MVILPFLSIHRSYILSKKIRCVSPAIKHAQENVITFRGEEQNNQFFVFKEIVEKRARELRRKEIPSSSSSLFIAEELNKLGELKQKGLINQEEFDARKKKLLDS
ncbi:SHOCT domain-containing protein [Dolichospermum sp. UHCC 0406]|nr:SHOCT domain-containing protein [Dolichospermum sp. UHCC 0406]